MTAKEYNNGVRQWADDVMRFATRCCHEQSECEDAVQEAFASLWEHRGEVSEAKGKSYLMGAAYKQLMSRFRHVKVERQHSDMVRGDEAMAPDEGFDLKEAIHKALQTLPELQRAILSLKDQEGYTYHEIAQTLGQSEERVQVYLFRARVAMRRQLTAMGYHPNS